MLTTCYDIKSRTSNNACNDSIQVPVIRALEALGAKVKLSVELEKKN